MKHAALIPADILPTRQGAGVVIHCEDRAWRSSDGKSAPHINHAPQQFPRVGEVLPALGEGCPGAGTKENVITMGLDVDLLRKMADAFVTTQLTLFIRPTHINADPHPRPRTLPRAAPRNLAPYVTQSVAVCPAQSEDVEGVGVLMPLIPNNKQVYYETIRRQVVAAEQAVMPKSAATSTVRAPGK